MRDTNKLQLKEISGKNWQMVYVFDLNNEVIRNLFVYIHLFTFGN